MVRRWKTIRVFISSTFRDTHFERDALTRLVFPELREYCEERYLRITEVDLRWGVTQEESAEGKAIEICLDEIDRSDIFLGLIGSRYGWIPDEYQVGSEERFDWVRQQSNLSITELEIMRGCLNPEGENAQNVSHALFYFRSEDILADLRDTPKLMCEYTDGHTEYKTGRLVYVPDLEKEEKLVQLKNRIRNYKPGRIKSVCRENYEALYHKEGNLSKMNPKRLRKFCDMILQDLKNSIDERFPVAKMSQVTEVSEVELEKKYHTAFIETRLNYFHPRKQLVDKVVGYSSSSLVNGPFIVVAPPGTGKSSVISAACSIIEARIAQSKKKSLAARFTQAKNNTKPEIMLRYFVGASPGSLHISRMLRVLLHELRSAINTYKPKKRVNQLWSMLRSSLRVGSTMTLAGKLEASKKGTNSMQTPLLPTNPSSKRYKIQSNMPSNFQDLVEEFKRTLIEACECCRVILVVDNLDHTIRDKGNPVLRWLPSDLPNNLRLIVGVDGQVCEDAGREEGRPSSPKSEPGKIRKSITLSKTNMQTAMSVQSVVDHGTGNAARSYYDNFLLHFKSRVMTLPVPGCSEELSKAIVIGRLQAYGKKLGDQQIQILLNKRSASNPTWLVMVCEELRVFSQYERVTEEILALPEDLPTLLAQMITRLENDHGQVFVQDTLSLLACSRDGLYENELVEILGVRMSDWSRLFYSLKPLLNNATRNQDELISFSHRHFLLAVLQRYFPVEELHQNFGVLSTSSAGMDQLEDEDVQARLRSDIAAPIHARLALFFKSAAFDSEQDCWRSESGRALSCLPYHLLQGKMFKTLEVTLTDLQFVEALLIAGWGFNWVDDLSFALTTFEHRYLIDHHNDFAPPGLGLDVLPENAFLNGEDSMVPSSLHDERVVTIEMKSRIRDYYGFAQRYTPELNANPSLVYQYASNLPDTNAACIAAHGLWVSGKEGYVRRPWLKYINKPQEAGPCLMTLSGHTAEVLCCAISSDEKRVVSGSNDCTVRVWVVQTGENLLILEKHEQPVTCVAFSPASKNNAIVVSTSRDGTACVWVDGLLLKHFTKHQNIPIFSCAITECGNWVASGDKSGRLMVWDMLQTDVDDDCIHDFCNFHGCITKIRFSADNSHIFAAADDRTIRGWNLLDGNQYMCKTGTAMTLATEFVDATSKMLYCIRTSAMRLKILDAKDVHKSLSQPSNISILGMPMDGPQAYGQDYADELGVLSEDVYADAQSLHNSEIIREVEDEMNAPTKNSKETPVAILEDPEIPLVTVCGLSADSRLATGRVDGNISIYNVKTGQKVCNLLGHISKINDISYSHSGKVIVSASNDCMVKIWNPRRARLKAKTPHKTQVTNLSFSQSKAGACLLSISGEGLVSMWNTQNGYRTSLNSSDVRELISDARFVSRAESYVTVANAVRVFSNDNKVRTRMIPQHNVVTWDLSPCGKILATVENGAQDIHVWNLSCNPVKHVQVVEKAHDKKVTECKFSKDGAIVYTTGNDGKLKLWDSLHLCAEAYAGAQTERESIKPIIVLQDSKDMGLASLILRLYESPNGRGMLSVSDSPDLKHWDLESALEHSTYGKGQFVSHVHGHTNRVMCAAWAPHGFHFVSGAANGRIRIWNKSTMHCTSIINGHTSSVEEIQYLPDGRRFASISSDKTLSIWAAANGEQINCMTFASGLTALSVSGDGEYIGVGDTKGDLRILKVMCPLTAADSKEIVKQAGYENLKSSVVNQPKMQNFNVVEDQDVIACAEDNKKYEFPNVLMNVPYNEFPFACPEKIVYLTVKGRKKWASKCEVLCPHCGKSFPISGNATKLLQKQEHDISMEGVTRYALLDERFLHLCLYCRKIMRLTPFFMDRSGIFKKLHWKRHITKLQILRTITHKREKELAKELRNQARPTFYDGSASSMAPFHSSRDGKRLRKITVSKGDSSGTGDNHDIMARHAHALELRRHQADDGQFKPRTTISIPAKVPGRKVSDGGDMNMPDSGEEKSLDTSEEKLGGSKKIRSNSSRRKRRSSQMKSMPSLLTSSRVTAPSWLSVFSQFEDESLEEFHKCEERKRNENSCETPDGGDRPSVAPLSGYSTGMVSSRVLTGTPHSRSSSQFKKKLHTRAFCDDKFLEREGALIRRCNTASMGVLRRQAKTPAEFKILKSTTDLRVPENMYSILHGIPRDTQLQTIRKVTPYNLDIIPSVLDFGTLCENKVYRLPVQLLNKSSAVTRFRAAIENQSDQECDRGERSNDLVVIQAPESNPLVQGLRATLHVELRAYKTGRLFGQLRISTNNGHLFSTPVIATIASEADFASSLQRSLAVKNEDITNKDVICMVKPKFS